MHGSSAVNLVAARARQVATAQGLDPNTVPAQATRVAPESLVQPLLRDGLRLWRSRVGADGIYRLGRDGTIADLVETGLLGPRTLLVTMTSDEPESWFVSYAGRTLDNLFAVPSIVGQRFVELPSPGVTRTSAATIAATLPEARVAAHRICGQAPGRAIAYDRLLLPVAGRRGAVNRFITLSQYVDGIAP